MTRSEMTALIKSEMIPGPSSTPPSTPRALPAHSLKTRSEMTNHDEEKAISRTAPEPKIFTRSLRKSLRLSPVTIRMCQSHCACAQWPIAHFPRATCLRRPPYKLFTQPCGPGPAECAQRLNSPGLSPEGCPSTYDQFTCTYNLRLVAFLLVILYSQS